MTKLNQHLEWAGEDDKIEGIMPWHWRGESPEIFHYHCSSFVRFPSLKKCPGGRRGTWPAKSLPDYMRLGARDNPLLVAALKSMRVPAPQSASFWPALP